MRKLKGLEDVIECCIVHWSKGDTNQKTGKPGWRFATADEDEPLCSPDSVLGAKYLSEIYFHDEPNYQGR